IAVASPCATTGSIAWSKKRQQCARRGPAIHIPCGWGREKGVDKPLHPNAANGREHVINS
ncbi:MAG: hypothetical protein ABS955_11825, partial [Stenotrophomonas maltophilia]